MKTIDQILEQFDIFFVGETYGYGTTGYEPNDVREAMKLYGEEYGKECLKIAAEQAQVEMKLDNPFGNSLDMYPVLIKSSILNIQLPPHE